jgi:enamine deaminase RidA (YjgF/YER057c/UK114 family)
VNQDMPKITLSNPSTLPPPMGFSHLAKVNHGQALYISGQVARDASGEIIGKGDFRAQLEQVFRNLQTAVSEAGGSMHDIVKLNYYCVASVDQSELAAVVEVRDRYVNAGTPPASTFVVVNRLVHPAWLIEIEAVAVL